MTALDAHSAKSRRGARESRYFIAIVVCLTALALCPGALSLRATGGYYDDNGFYTAGTADPCAGHGGSTGPPTTGYDPLTGKWFDEFSCADGTTVRVDRPAPWLPYAEEANYEPDASPAACVAAHYTDEGWDEGTC